MFDSATLNLFGAITAFVVVTVFGRDWLAGRRIAGREVSKALAQSIAGAAGLAVAVGFLLAVG
ncbi:hypothetical protein [Neoroseomonas soli]|uniref:Uncharacterized protein n=1 Tax=Neoroseomonas soli TaxID=1081025 RepID=A0A9X9WVK6_9PROT|nr:hypothetical protein [Neoroseomonas soli]MBR0671185.1 hypothetical protein [Neoroseomonas soli]